MRYVAVSEVTDTHADIHTQMTTVTLAHVPRANTIK